MSDHREHRRVCCADAARRYLAALATPPAPTEDATPHDVRGHFPFHEYPHPTDHTHAAPTEDACTCGPYAPCPLHDAPTEDATLDALRAAIERLTITSERDRLLAILARSAPITESALAEALARLAEAIEGERRHWHTVEVRPDDVAAILAALRPKDSL